MFEGGQDNQEYISNLAIYTNYIINIAARLANGSPIQWKVFHRGRCASLIDPEGAGVQRPQCKAAGQAHELLARFSSTFATVALSACAGAVAPRGPVGKVAAVTEAAAAAGGVGCFRCFLPLFFSFGRVKVEIAMYGCVSAGYDWDVTLMNIQYY